MPCENHLHSYFRVSGYYAMLKVEPVTPAAPSLIIFMLCTDAKYDNEIIIRRWKYVEACKLKKRGIGVVSNGVDGAGPFLKAMTLTTSIFIKWCWWGCWCWCWWCWCWW